MIGVPPRIGHDIYAVGRCSHQPFSTWFVQHNGARRVKEKHLGPVFVLFVPGGCLTVG